MALAAARESDYLERSVSALAESVSSYYEGILPFYELETAGRHDLAFWKDLCRAQRPGRVLELGCGLGRVTEVLARNARWVAGVDISLPMLSRAHGRRGSARLHLTAADMRRLPFGAGFDLIAAPSDPMSHLISSHDRRSALSGVARALRRGGKFVLDGLHLRHEAPRIRRRRVAVPHGVLSILESWKPLPERDRWNVRFTYRLQTGDVSRRKSSCFVARAWDPEEIVPFFGSCGLGVEEMWGGFAREPFQRESPRVIVVAKKGPSGPEVSV
jgi:SAM-dependent methyltransferase